MKTCSCCKNTLNDSDFYNKGKENRTNSFCKKCFNAYCMKRWIDRKIRIIGQFGNRCKDCNNSFHYAVYEFHHLNPDTKELNWTRMRLLSEAKMQAELAKCVMLCANCHRMRHVEQRLSS